MPKHNVSSFVATNLNLWMLGIDASAVIGLRMLKVAQGGTGTAEEAALMVREKIQAATEIHAALLSGKLGMTPVAVSRSVVARYSRKVRANRKRLSQL